jgi:arginine/lysine/ornithine decarboxylase
MLNILALLSACRPGGRVLVNRDAHSSVTAAMVHGGFEPVYLVPPYDAELGISLGPTRRDFEALLSRRVDCVFLTSPNYFGVVGELDAIIAVAHERGLPVVVDGAHAPHFHFCRGLPRGAEDLGADYVTQSTHKVATALSQGSLLLLQSEKDKDSLYEQVNELGLVSTSFSYPILASLEMGVRQLAEEGEALWNGAIDLAEALRGMCRRLPGIRVLGPEAVPRPGFEDLDRTRVALDVSGVNATGFELAQRLQTRRVYPEMSTLRHVLFLVTPATTWRDIHTLHEVLQSTLQHLTRRPHRDAPAPPAVPQMALIPRVAKFSPKRAIPIGAAAGHISGETIATYPPGVPIIAAGEIVEREVLEYLCEMQRCGAVLKGASDPDFSTIRVI